MTVNSDEVVIVRIEFVTIHQSWDIELLRNAATNGEKIYSDELCSTKIIIIDV